MTDRDREIERLTEVFKDAILHAPIPDVNPNLIRAVESQARECALRVVGDAPQAPAERRWPQVRWCVCGHAEAAHHRGGACSLDHEDGSGAPCDCRVFGEMAFTRRMREADEKAVL